MKHAGTEQYSHAWRTGDFVIRNDRATLHPATADYAETEKRLMYRTMLRGRADALRKTRDSSQSMFIPPPALSTWPVIWPTSSEAMKAMAAACSSDTPLRFMGTILIILRVISKR